MHVPQLQIALQVRVPPFSQLPVVFAAHSPCPSQGPLGSFHWPVVVLQVRAWRPQRPHATNGSPAHCWPRQSPHWQLLAQVRVPPFSQPIVAVGVHTPWSVQAPDGAFHMPVSPLQVRACRPHIAHATHGSPLHIWFVQAPHWQLALHVRLPMFWQVPVVFAAHSPWSVQAPLGSFHSPVSVLQVRARRPHIPQDTNASPVQRWPVQPVGH